VLFPGAQLPLRLFEQRYLERAKACFRDGSPFGVCLILEGREVGEPALPAQVGCLARIEQWDMPQLGVLNIIARGEQRFRVVERRLQPDGLARATVELLAEAREEGDDGERLSALLVALPLPLPLNQELLEMPGPRARLERLNRFLEVAARE
jgi:Lon protease-like protein